MAKKPNFLSVIFIAALLTSWAGTCTLAVGAAKLLPHEAYVWQRSWHEGVTNAIVTLATNFTELIALRAEVIWTAGKPQVVSIPVDYLAVLGCGRPFGIALRIGTFSGPFAADDFRTRWLVELASSLVKEAAAQKITLAEFQLDFDCAESKLEGYGVWVKTIRKRISPLPLTITALPTWLKQPACRDLLAATDGYVLQLHSLDRPKDVRASFTLCDAKSAQAFVGAAAALGRPFRVALPTYGYLAAFDASGLFAGLSAEGPSPNWQRDWQVREVRADAKAMAELVRTWNHQHPDELTGIIWYRLPVSSDRLNWRWPTLSKVMAGELPQADIRIAVKSPQPGLSEIEWINTGTGDYVGPAKVAVSWTSGRLVAGDGFQGGELVETGAQSVEFRNVGGDIRVPPGERWRMGWVRLESAGEVKVRRSD